MPAALTPGQQSQFLASPAAAGFVLQMGLPAAISAIPSWGEIIGWNGLSVLVWADASGVWHYIDVSDSPQLISSVNGAAYVPPNSSTIDNIEQSIGQAVATAESAAAGAVSWAPWIIGAIVLVAVLPYLPKAKRT